MSEQKMHVGCVALVGQPNVGKSTLTNALLGEQLSIVTPKPQTTRGKIVGVVNTAHAQIVLLDTPGYHRSHRTLNSAMIDVVNQAMEEADILILLVDAANPDMALDRELYQRMKAKPHLVVLNKCDVVPRERFESLANQLHDEWGATEVIAVSALHNIGIDLLRDTCARILPEGMPIYPRDEYTTHSMRFLASEIIREQVFLQMQQEIPYSCAVQVTRYQEPTAERNITSIFADVIVDRLAHKSMLIGSGGKRIKAIGTKARQKLESLVGGKVFLDLSVVVDEGWTTDPQKVREYGAI